MTMDKDSRIYIAGHRGLVGSAIVRTLQAEGYTNLVVRSRDQVDLSDAKAVEDFFASRQPEYVFLAAARVGGILANVTYPADFIRDNLAIGLNVIHQCFKAGVKRLLFLGSSCIYPRQAVQPMRESALLTGLPEPTNSAYAVAKIAGVEMCWAYNRQYGTRFVPVMPTNLYGPGDNFDLTDSHVLPALIRKFHLAKLAQQDNWAAIEQDQRCFGPIPDEIKARLRAGGRCPEVVLWGSGTVRREFLYVDDLAAACVRLMTTDFETLARGKEFRAGENPFLFNIGTGKDLTIKDLAAKVADVVGFKGAILWDTTKPDGIERKLLDVSRLKSLGWNPRVGLEEGIARTYGWYVARLEKAGNGS